MGAILKINLCPFFFSSQHPVTSVCLLEHYEQLTVIMDYFQLVERFVPGDRLLCLDDDFRYKYVITGREPSSNGFGAETYYGQDFLYKTKTGRTFVFALPYPFLRKVDAPNFPRAKVEIDRYTRLPDAIALIDHFETDLYENAVVPIALAHRYTAISLVPGGTVLDLLSFGETNR